MIDHQNPITVDLLAENEHVAVDAPGNDTSVFCDAVIVISDAARDIETPERPRAVPCPAREYSMGNTAQFAKLFELIIGDAIIGNKLQYYDLPFPNPIYRRLASLSLVMKYSQILSEIKLKVIVRHANGGLVT